MTRSHDLFEAAQRHIPGGVNSPVRAFRGVGGDPVFVASGSGPHLVDADGRRYLDYVGSWGPLILGHAHPEGNWQIQRVREDQVLDRLGPHSRFRQVVPLLPNDAQRRRLRHRLRAEVEHHVVAPRIRA